MIDTRIALRDVARQLGLQDSAGATAAPQALYEAERALLETGQVIPIVFVPTLYAISLRIRKWDAAQPQRSTWWRLEKCGFRHELLDQDPAEHHLDGRDCGCRGRVGGVGDDDTVL